jgi:acetyl/propionyl-CoA carboxylase alpha subunit
LTRILDLIDDPKSVTDQMSNMQGTRAKKLLIANRAEIAIRITEAAAALGFQTVAVYSEDDAGSLHVIRADAARQLSGTGAAAYLDAEQIISIAKQDGCDAIHPGYGFLSENPAFARRCSEAGLIFIGPSPELLELFGNKVAARDLARQCGVPTLPGTAAASLAEARSFVESASGLPVVSRGRRWRPRHSHRHKARRD